MSAPRVLCVVAAVGLVLATGPTRVAAAPLLGGTLRVQGHPVVEDLPTPILIEVVNRSNIPMQIRLSVSGGGYELAATDLGVVGPGATASTTLKTIGTGDAVLTADLTQVDPPGVSGVDTVALRLSLDLRHRNALEQLAAAVGSSVPPWLLPGVALLGLGLILLLRSRRRSVRRWHP